MAKGTIFSFERYEKKYFLTEAGAHRLLGIMDRYLKPDAYGEYTVCNIYYDTDDWRIISVSCEKPDYKEKLRVRSYGVPEAGDNVFSELKKKCSGIVCKFRIVTAADEITAFLNRTDLAGSQTENEIIWFQKVYKTNPKVFIGYDRTAFSGKFDHGLRTGFGETSGKDRLLKITIPENLDYDGLFDDLFEQCTTSHSLVKVKTVSMGTLYELRYQVALKNDPVKKEFLDSIRCRNGNLNIVCCKEQSKDTL